MSRKTVSIVVLHGWAIDEKNILKWQPLVEALQQRQIEIEILALPGLTTPLSEPWKVQDYLDWIEAQLTSRQQVILLGHSFGGQLAIRYTAQHPQQVKRLVLIDSAGIRDESRKARLKRAFFQFAAKLGKPIFRHNFFRRFLYKLAGEHDYEQAPPAMRQTLTNVVKDHIKKDLSKIKVPTLLIWGRLDKATPLWIGEELQRGIKDSQLVTIDEARHSPQFTHSQKVADLVADFCLD